MILFILTVGSAGALSKYSADGGKVSIEDRYRYASESESKCRRGNGWPFPGCLRAVGREYADLARDGAPVFTARFIPVFEEVFPRNPTDAFYMARDGWLTETGGHDDRFKPFVEVTYDAVVARLSERSVRAGDRYAEKKGFCKKLEAVGEVYPVPRALGQVAEDLFRYEEAQAWYATSGDNNLYCGLLSSNPYVYADFRDAGIASTAMEMARTIGDTRLHEFSNGIPTSWGEYGMPWTEGRSVEYWHSTAELQSQEYQQSRTDHSWEVATVYWAMGGMTQTEIFDRIRPFAARAELDRAYSVAVDMYVFIGDYENATRIVKLGK